MGNQGRPGRPSNNWVPGGPTDRILCALTAAGGAPVSSLDLAAASGLEIGRLHHYMDRLRRQGRVVAMGRIGRGKVGAYQTYKLKAAASPPAAL